MDVEMETRTVEREYVTINGESFPADVALDFLESVAGTSAFGGIRGTVGAERRFAEELVEEDVLGHRHSAGFFERDEESRRELTETIRERYL